jgi:hypothetical protein
MKFCSVTKISKLYVVNTGTPEAVTSLRLVEMTVMSSFTNAEHAASIAVIRVSAVSVSSTWIVR